MTVQDRNRSLPAWGLTAENKARNKENIRKHALYFIERYRMHITFPLTRNTKVGAPSESCLATQFYAISTLDHCRSGEEVDKWFSTLAEWLLFISIPQELLHSLCKLALLQITMTLLFSSTERWLAWYAKGKNHSPWLLPLCLTSCYFTLLQMLFKHFWNSLELRSIPISMSMSTFSIKSREGCESR